MYFRWLFEQYCSKHRTVMTLRPVAADGIRTVLHGFESRPNRAASGWLRTVSDGYGRLLVGPQSGLPYIDYIGLPTFHHFNVKKAQTLQPNGLEKFHKITNKTVKIPKTVQY